jgi:DNA primase
MEGAQPLSEFLFACLQEGLNTTSIDGKARLSQLAAPLINRIPEGVFRQLMLKELARRTDMDIDALATIIIPPAAETEPAPEDHQPPPEYDDYTPSQDNAPLWDGEHYGPAGDHAPEPTNTQPRRRLRLSPLQRLILLLLHQPQLRTELAGLQDLPQLDDPDAETLVNLCALLDEQPHYTLNHILGYWRGIHGAEEGEKLARIVAADMLGGSQQSLRDDVAEFRDICRHLEEKLFIKRPAKAQLEELLGRDELSPQERKRITLLWHQELAEDERTPDLYQLMKQKLTAKQRAKN